MFFWALLILGTAVLGLVLVITYLRLDSSWPPPGNSVQDIRQHVSETEEQEVPSEYSHRSWAPFYNRSGVEGQSGDLPRILVWTSTETSWQFRNIDEHTGHEPYSGCSHRCYVTSDRDLIHVSDAVVFNGRDLLPSDLPSRKPRFQKYVYWSSEPPEHMNTLEMPIMFEWSMTYRLDSHIVNPQTIISRPAAPAVTLSKWSAYRLWRTKSRIAARESVSCKVSGIQHDYIDELQRLIIVDDFGKCGVNNCNTFGTEQCEIIFERDYLFYLAFEDAFCKDYVSERFYEMLELNIVPVVLGAANYSVIAPPGSYIDALGFETPRDLLDYLEIVANNFTLYYSYLHWKTMYKVHRWTDYNFCQLCNKLQEQELNFTTDDENLTEWWIDVLSCHL